MAVTRRRPASRRSCTTPTAAASTRSLAFGRHAARLRHHGLAWASRGDAYDNAAAESFIATIKKELIYRHTLQDEGTPQGSAIFDYIERFYNPVRRHSTLGNKSPVNYELAAAAAAT